MKDSVLLDGKIYISSRRAAEISHYTTDYVGQLCRSGKVDCRIVGRAWFVTEESVLAHQKMMADSLTNGFSQSNHLDQKNISTASTDVAVPTLTPSAFSLRNHQVQKAKEVRTAADINTKTEGSAYGRNGRDEPSRVGETTKKSHFFKISKLSAAGAFVVFSMILLGSVINQNNPQFVSSLADSVVVQPIVLAVNSTVGDTLEKTSIPADYASVSDAFAYGWNGFIGGVSSGILNIFNFSTVTGGETSPILAVSPQASANPITSASTGTGVSTSTVVFEQTTASVPIVTNKITNNTKTLYLTDPSVAITLSSLQNQIDAEKSFLTTQVDSLAENFGRSFVVSSAGSGISSGNGSGVTNLDASNISSGVLAVSYGGTGLSSASAESLLLSDSSGNPYWGTTTPSFTLGGAIAGNNENLTGLNELSAVQVVATGANVSNLIASTSLALPYLAGFGSTQCLQVDTNGIVSATGAACGNGGGGSVNKVSNSDGTLTISPSGGTGVVTVSLNPAHANTWTGAQTFNATTTLATTTAGTLSVTATTTTGNLSVGSLNGLLFGTNGVVSAISTSSVCPSCLTGNQNITLSGDISGSGTTSINITLATTGVTAGLYGSATSSANITVDAKGRITAASSTLITPTFSSITGTPTTVAGYGIVNGAGIDALGAVSSNGVLLRTGSNTYTAIGTSSLGLLTTNVAEGTNLYYTTARAEADAQAAISVSGLPLTYSSGVIGINQASTTGAGYLSSADWNTFNNKASTTVANTWTALQTFSNVSVVNATTTNLTSSGNSYLGTILAGTWNASVLGSNYGGAGSVSGILKANGSGVVSAASAGSDYLAPNGNGSGLTNLSASALSGIVAVANGGTGFSSASTSAFFLTNSSGTPYTGTTTPAFTLGGTVTGSNQNITGLALLSSTGGTFTNATATNVVATNATTTNLSTTNFTANGNVTFSNITGTTSCLQVNASGTVSGTGAGCGTGNGSGAVNAVSNSDGSLTVGPTTGAVVVSLNPNNSNTWTALQIFGNNISFGGASTSITSLASDQFLKYNGSNWVNAGIATSDISGVVGVVNGGTGTSTALANNLLIGNASGNGWTEIGTSSLGLQAVGTYITALTGDVTASGPGSAAATLATTGVTAGLYGSATSSANITVDAKGRITAASSTLITPAFSSITGTPTTVAGYGIVNGAGIDALGSVSSNGVLLRTGSNTYTAIGTSSLGLLTTNVAEGTNLYYTTARAEADARTAISVSGLPLTYSSGVISINQASITGSGYLSAADWNTFNNKLSVENNSNWSGTPLASGNGGTGTTTALANDLLIGNASGTGWTEISTSSLGISTSQWTTLGSNIYYNVAGGQVAIGTSTPGADLYIQQAFGSASPLFSIASTTSAAFATSSLFTVLANGNVGIGSSTPYAELSVQGSMATVPQLSLGYDAGDNVTASVNSVGALTFNLNGSNAGMIINDNSQPATVSSGYGTDATTSFDLVGATGGNTNDSGYGYKGGVGGAITLMSGTGGIGTNNTANTVNGGSGGPITIQGGSGGSETGLPSTQTQGGSGGPITIQGGSGGNSVGDLLNVGGRGGSLHLLGGNSGSGSAIDWGGGNVYIAGGLGGTATNGDTYLGVYNNVNDSANQGNVYLGYNQSIYNTSNDSLGIGTTTPGSTLTVIGDAFITGNATTTNIIATGTLSVSGNTTLASSLNGLLFSTNGLVSSLATSSITNLSNLAIIGTLTSGSIGSGFGNINIGSNIFTGNGSGLTSLSASAINSGVLASTYGGTGTSTTLANDLLIGNSSGTGWTEVGTSSLGLLSATAIGSALAGQIPYYAANGTTLTATSSIFIATSTGYVGIGNVVPQSTLDVTGELLVSNATSAVPILNQGIDLVENGTAGAITETDFGVNGTTNSPAFTGIAARGTLSLPAAVQADDVLSSINARGYTGTNFSTSSVAAFRINAADTWTNTDNGTYLSFLATANGTTTKSEVMRILGNGNVGIGTTTPGSALTVAGNGYFSGSITATNATTTSLAVTGSGTTTFSGGIVATCFATSTGGPCITGGGSSGGVSLSGTNTWTGQQTFSLAPIFNSSPTFSTETAGSIFFAGSGGLLSQNNSNFFWDNTNNALDIGTTSAITSNGNAGVLNVLGTTTSTVNLALFRANVNNYARVAVVNANAGATSSANFIVGNNLNDASSTSYYGDFGINSSGNANANYTGLLPNDTFLYSSDGGLDLGTATSSASSTIRFFTGGLLSANQRLTITSQGFIGIGTTSPSNALEVNGNGYFSGNFGVGTTTGTTTIASNVQVNYGSLAYDVPSGVTNIDSLQTGALNFDTDAGAISWADLPLDSTPIQGTIESYSAQVGDSPILTVYGEANGSGGVQNTRVGIGTTSPVSVLAVVGTTTFAGNVMPGKDNTYSLGTSTARWSTLYSHVLNTGDVLFGNNFDLLEAKNPDGTIATNTGAGMVWENGTGTPIFSLDASGNLAVNGDVCAFGSFGSSTQCLGSAWNNLDALTSQVSALSSITVTLGNVNTSASTSLADLATQIASLNTQVAALTSFASSTTAWMSATSTFAASAASTTATTLASSTPFIQTIANAVIAILQSSGQVIQSAATWTVNEIHATLAVFSDVRTSSIETQTASVTNGIEMTSPNGQVWCVRAGDTGILQQTSGSCTTAVLMSVTATSTSSETSSTTIENSNNNQEPITSTISSTATSTTTTTVTPTTATTTLIVSSTTDSLPTTSPSATTTDSTDATTTPALVPIPTPTSSAPSDSSVLTSTSTSTSDSASASTDSSDTTTTP